MQLSKTGGVTLPNPSTAPVGINVECGPPLAGNSNMGNIANMVVCGVSFLVVGFLLLHVNKRKAAVGRVELRTLVVFYLLSLPFQLVTNGSVLQQGSTALVVLTAILAGTIAALFWVLLMNGLVSTQVVEDGTMASIIPLYGIAFLFFAATTYISLDTALLFTSAFKSTPPQALRNVALFVLTNVWPGVAIILYFLLMTWVIIGVLREKKPMIYLILAFVTFAASQAVYLVANKPLCLAANAKVDGSFLATLLETFTVGLLVATWTSVTEETWEEERYY